MRPILKIVNLADIVALMEFSEKKVEYLRRAVESSGVIRNPFALAPIEDRKYLLLEDTALMEAVRMEGFTHIPAQIVPFSESLESTADMLIGGMQPVYLDDFRKLFPRDCAIGSGEADSGSEKFSTVISFSMKENQNLLICFRKNGAGVISPAVFSFFDYLKRHCTLIEKVYPGEVRAINLKQATGNCIMEAANITERDIHFAADRGLLFPSGLLKLEYGCRIMRIDYPVGILKADATLREKEQFLHDLVNYRLSSGCSRFLRSGIYLLNY
ncbi:MAG: hypothetical protein JSU69_00450 [Candidatus Zixiibacteriota bacterium]|nr:MAG: hypothetical protein JSU69_00450 [candidate division Zixibacteria bacterium]